MDEYGTCAIIPTGKPPPLAVRLEKALPFRRWVATRASCGSPASQATLQPQAQRGERRTGGTPYPENISEARSWCHLRFSAPRGMSPPPPPSGGILPQYPPLGGILKPPALRVVDDFGCEFSEVQTLLAFALV